MMTLCPFTRTRRCRFADAVRQAVPRPQSELGAPTRPPTRRVAVVSLAQVGPYHNPSEAYSWDVLPHCGSLEGVLDAVKADVEDGHHRANSLGAALEGRRREMTAYRLPFRANVELTPLCELDVGVAETKRVQLAAANDWYWRLEADGLPAWGFVGRPPGDTDAAGPYGSLNTHVHFDIGVDRRTRTRVVEVATSTDPTLSVALPAPGSGKALGVITLWYSVAWHDSDVPVDGRLDAYRAHAFSAERLTIGWMSVGGSAAVVALLAVSLAAALRRTLRADLARYERDLERSSGGVIDVDDSGWKHVAGDVFRTPPRPAALCALAGAGKHLALLGLAVSALGVAGVLDAADRAATRSAVVGVYAVTAGVAGHAAVSLYVRLGGRRWARCLVASVAAFGMPAALVFAIDNSTALAYGSISALPAWAVASLVALSLLVTLPLHLIGGLIGRRAPADLGAPVRTNRFARAVPPQPWWRRLPAQCVLGGLLPLGGVYAELPYLWATLWTHRTFTVWPLLLLSFALAITSSALASAGAVYSSLEGEDHRWWWRSFLVGASLGPWLMLYSVAWWWFRGSMTGFLQALFYFNQCALVALAAGLAGGWAGLGTSLWMVRRMYTEVKMD